MNNFRHTGKVLNLVAPTGGVTKGVPVRIGDFFCIPQETAAVSVAFRGYVSGVFELVKDSGTAWTAGQAVYWDVSATEVTHDPLLGDCIGYAVEAEGSAIVLADVQLNGVSVNAVQSLYVVRRRCTVAEINSGVELLPAIAGRKYSVIDMTMIAYGGAVGTATTVDVLATQAAGSVKLMASAVAALTQSAVLRAGASNADVLADGASYVANDAGTAITVGKTGGAADTATGVDVFVTYVVGK